MSRKKNPSLAYQMRQAINNNFKEGTSKRAAKMSDGGTGSRVYGYSHRKDLIELGSQFANFCRDNFGVKLVKNINSSHVDAFLKEKAKTCADTTLKTYYTNLNKLNKVVNASYSSCKADWGKGVNIPTGRNQTKQRDVKISRESMNKVLDKLDMRHASHRAIACAEALGLRASETVKLRGEHIDLKKGIVTIQGKGGRVREIPIPEARKELLTTLKEQYSECRIATVKPDSVNATFSRICEREGLTDLDGSKSGIHAVRKLWATEQFEEKIEQGLSEKDAWGDVSQALGHGRDRMDLYGVYIVR